MATQTDGSAQPDNAAFFLKLAIAIAITVVTAFSLNLALGRSSFAAPLVVHIHAVVFMGWVGIYVLQNWLVASGRVAVHRQLGWLALGWVLLMLVFGLAVTVSVVQRGATPFFFLPQHFLIANPLGLLGFIGLLMAAIVMRRRTDWHRRLQLCAMATIMGPAFGRLLPMPFMTPLAFEAASLAGLIFPIIALWRESRQGAVHPAWKWGLVPTPVLLVAALLLSQTAMADRLYQWVTEGTPGAAVAPLDYGTPPPGMGLS